MKKSRSGCLMVNDAAAETYVLLQMSSNMADSASK